MAVNGERVILGVDVSKDWLDWHREGAQGPQRICNERASIDGFLTGYRGAAIAVEPTNTYHELLVDRARKFGLVVYLVSGYQLKHYGQALAQRMLTDAIDARLIARFLSREIADLKPHEPKSPQEKLLWTLLKRRGKLVKIRHQIRQSLSGIKELRKVGEQLLQSHRKALAALDKQIQALVIALGWQPEVARLQAIPGVGPLTALALTVAYHAGTFIHHDPFIAYLGLDVRAKESGKFKGQRKLTKRGDGEYRRLLYCAAMSATQLPGYFQDRHQALLARGLTATAAYVVAARKLATIAFHLHRQQVEFDPAKLAHAAA